MEMAFSSSRKKREGEGLAQLHVYPTCFTGVAGIEPNQYLPTKQRTRVIWCFQFGLGKYPIKPVKTLTKQGLMEIKFSKSVKQSWFLS